MLLGLMEAEGIAILGPDDLKGADRAVMETHFFEQVFPILSPLAIDPAHPFPFIANGGFAMGLQLRREVDGTVLEALLPVPAQVPRFVRLPDGPKGELRFLPLEALLEVFLGKLFPGYRMLGHCAFRVLRDSDLEVEEEAEDLVREFETALKRRRRGEVIQLTMTADAPDDLRRTIVHALGVADGRGDRDAGPRRHGRPRRAHADRADATCCGRRSPRGCPSGCRTSTATCSRRSAARTCCCTIPTRASTSSCASSQQAARDPDVLAIKQTLYRTSRDSPIVAGEPQ